MSLSSSPPVVARLLLPDDANVSGNVHGGTILQLMEQAGMIAATRYCNIHCSDDYEYRGKQLAGLVRFETMSFHQPIFVGEVASVTADIIFTSESSVLVKVAVTAENATKGKSRLTNTGLLWYLSFVRINNNKDNNNKNGNHNTKDIITVPVPQIEAMPDNPEYVNAKTLYEARKNQNNNSTKKTEMECFDKEGCLCPKCREDYKVDESILSRTPSESVQTLCQCVLPSDCGTSNVAFGGFIMKLMDNAAGCCAFRHCRTNIVTVSINEMNFTGFVQLGDIVSIRAKMVFCSSKSMDISVTAFVTSALKADEGEQMVAHGIFTFVSLENKTNKVLSVPPLRYETKEEFDLAFAGQVRYEKSKQARSAKKQ